MEGVFRFKSWFLNAPGLIHGGLIIGILRYLKIYLRSLKARSSGVNAPKERENGRARAAQTSQEFSAHLMCDREIKTATL